MMRSAHSMLVAFALICGGCATRGNVELLESQLRQQEDELYALRAERDQAKAELRVVQQDAQSLRTQLAKQGKESLLPEQAQTLYRVAGVRVNEWFSGGLDRDDRPGDDLLNVVLTPHDEQGETVKLPGRVELEAIDLSAPESSRSLGVWTFDSEQVADSWQGGLTSGFQFRVPLEKPPMSNNIVVNARFATLDGRQFQTMADLHVTPSDTQYANQPNPSADGPALRTAVKPISSPAPRLEVAPSDPADDLKPSIPAQSTKNDNGEIEDFFPVEAPTNEAPGTKVKEQREQEFFPPTSNVPPKPVPPPAPPASDWGWKPLDPADQKTLPGELSSDVPADFQTVPEQATSDSLKRTDETTRNQPATKSSWSSLPSSDNGERKPLLFQPD